VTINIESWAKAFRVTFICFCVLTTAIAVAYAVALFYLYAFAHDPKHWGNVISFYAQPSSRPLGRVASANPAILGSLVVRGNDSSPIYATRYELSLADIKDSTLHDCLLAAEDKRFYRHAGINYFSLADAVLKHFISGERLRGASTISNQVVGEVILADRSRTGLRAYLRKFEEIILTNVAEQHFSKDDLLLAYVNNVPVGHLDGRALIGLSAASEALFGKRNPRALTLSEACTLAGILNRPDGYIKEAFKSDYPRLKKRRDTVLENLRWSNEERYSTEAIEQAKGEEIRFFKNGKQSASEPRQFISYAYQQLPDMKPGLRVQLTLDQDLQRAAEASVRQELDRFDRGPYGFYNQLSYSHAVKQGSKVTEGEAKLQASLVALDAKTGEILAMVGGRNSAGEFNRATQAKRAPGSTIKPFLFLFGIQSESYAGQRFRPNTIIDPARSSAVQRYTTGGAARATVQLARSDNGAVVAIAQEFGIARVQQFVAKLTGTNPAASELIAIGAGKGIEITPLQLAATYTIFPNHGLKADPNPISTVYKNGTRLKGSEHNPVRLADADAASIVTRMLQSVVGHGADGQYGTAKSARKLAGLEASVEFAGKTGSTNSDLWFVGFTPRLVVVVWVGFDNNYPEFEIAKGFQGAGMPLRIWAGFMLGVKKYRPDLLIGNFRQAPEH
jgi:membrane peptidoglycan carboxypeptidase